MRAKSVSCLLLHCALLGISGLLVILSITQALLQWKFRTPFPYMDMISIVGFLDSIPSPSILDLYLYVRDNEHRPIVSFLFFLHDRNNYGDSGEFLYRSIFATESLTVICFFLALLYLRRHIMWSVQLTLAATIGYLFFSAVHYENLAWQKQIHEVSCITLLTLGILAAAAVSTGGDACRHHRADVAAATGSGVLCLLASYSFGFGLISWPVVAAHAVLASWRRGPLIVYAIFAVFTIVTYACTYIILPEHTNPITAILSPLHVADYSLGLIGVLPYNLFSDLHLGTLARPAALAMSLLAVGFAGYRMCHLYLIPTGVPIERQHRTVAYYSAMLVVIALGMAVMVGLGRATINSGFESRYAIIGAVFWSGVLLLVVSTLRPGVASVFILLFSVTVASTGTLLAGRYESVLRYHHQRLFQAGTLATLGQHLWPQAPAIHPSLDLLKRVWTRPREPFRRFSERAPFGWIGASMQQLPPAPSSSQCLGHIDAVTPLSDGGRTVKIRGWGFIAADNTALKWVLATNKDSIVTGAGVTGLSRPDVRKHFARAGVDQNPYDQLYAGFEIAASAGEMLFIWGIDKAGRACKLAM